MIPAERRLGYLPWLDGLRALAVLAVIGDHENLQLRARWLRWLGPAGFVGVDVFFVISGFLITSLLLQELNRTGRVGFRDFYERRARRLLPALAVLLAVVLVGGLALEPGHRIHVVAAAGAASFYSANWVQAFGHTHLASLAHTWSLACEEQFYLLWPALLVGGAAIGLKGRRLVATLGAASILALVYPVAAAQAHWSMFRLYYGLDTHAAGLLLGATLGAAWTYRLLPSGPGWRTPRRVTGAAGALGLLVLIRWGEGISRRLAPLVPHLRVLTGDYYVVTDYLLASVAALAVLWALLDEPVGAAHRVLAWAPARGLGRISYGLYLYSAPLTLLLTPSTTGIHSSVLLVVIHVGVAVSAAWVSYAVIERRWLRKSATNRAEPGVSAGAESAQPGVSVGMEQLAPDRLIPRPSVGVPAWSESG
jgi:peptidoglycan/LPS O-acetylase OafA/YrhL